MKRAALQTVLAELAASGPEVCWNWPFGNNLDYGYLSWEGRSQVAHRVVYSVLIGPIPAGLYLDHLCRNKKCVNPSHLEPVTHQENIRRAYHGAKAQESGYHAPDLPVLASLRAVVDELLELIPERDELIRQALDEGHSERKIGDAAGMSGPAIHQRKTKP